MKLNPNHLPLMMAIQASSLLSGHRGHESGLSWQAARPSCCPKPNPTLLVLLTEVPGLTYTRQPAWKDFLPLMSRYLIDPPWNSLYDVHTNYTETIYTYRLILPLQRNVNKIEGPKSYKFWCSPRIHTNCFKPYTLNDFKQSSLIKKKF